MNIAPAAIAQYVSPGQLAPLQAVGEGASASRSPEALRPTQRVEQTKDRVYLSEEAQDLLKAEEGQLEQRGITREQSAVDDDSAAAPSADEADEGEASQSPSRREAPSEDPSILTEQEERVVDELQQRDREVRQHEQAHLSAAGGLAQGGIQYQFQRGPDGRSYAVGGSVRIDTAPVPGDPAATLRKMAQVRRAALAPLEPSTTDRAVAQQASATAAQARQELAANGGQSAEEAEQTEEVQAEETAQPTSATEPLSVSRLYQGIFG